MIVIDGPMHEMFSMIIAVMAVSTLVIVGIIFLYQLNKVQLGTQVARKLFPQECLSYGISIGVIVLFNSYKDTLNPYSGILLYLSVVFTFIVLAGSIIKFLRFAPARGVLLDVALPKNYIASFISSVISLILLLISLVFNEYSFFPLFLALGMFFLLLPIFGIVQQERGQYLITKDSLVNGTSTLPWVKISSYIWGKDVGEKTTLVYQSKSWWPSFLSYRTIEIPIEHKNRADSILEEYLHSSPEQKPIEQS